MSAPTNIDEYLAKVPSEVARATLGSLRAMIHEMVPEAEEAISYGVPAFKLNGPFIWFAAYKNHCSLFAGHTVRDFEDELKGYKTSKGTIQFPHDKPLPEPLLRSIVKARLDINLAKKKGK